MKKPRTLAAALTIAALAACSTSSAVEDHLLSRWDALGAGGQQQLCLGLAVKGEDWFSDQISGDHKDEAVAFFTEACESVTLPPAESFGFGIPA